MDLRLNYRDALDSERHMEIIDGAAVIEDRTSVSHNIAVNNIAAALRDYIAANGGTCKVFTENVALFVNELCNDDGYFFLPDVMAVCDTDGIKEDGVHVAPLFVAEVTSENTRKNDYCEKLEIYRKIGVGEYWVVDLQRKVLYKYLAAEDYIPVPIIHPEIVEVSVYDKLKIDLSEVMGA